METLQEIETLESGADPEEFLSSILAAKSEFGHPVGNITLYNDYHLVYKIRMDEESGGEHGSPILLSDLTTRKSIGNMVSIKAFIVKVSEPFLAKHVETEQVFDHEAKINRPKHTVEYGAERKASFVPGQGIIYNSYNVGKVGVVGLVEPLAVIRGIDVEAVFDMGYSEDIQLGEFSLTRPESKA